jgi:hypothetical protein
VLIGIALLAKPILRRQDAPPPPEPEPEPVRPPAPPRLSPPRVRLIAPRAAGGRHSSDRGIAIGYAASRDRGELERQAASIAQACEERGWALSNLVRDAATAERVAGLTPGLRHALKQLSRHAGSRLVVTSLDHVARSPAELTRLLAVCAKAGTDLVALDVGLDTGTREGRLAARCLVATETNGRAQNGSAGRAANGRGRRAPDRATQP